MRHVTKIERRARSIGLHLILTGSSFVFAIPFIWLFSTSCKVPDEMYPPRWIPQTPEGITESPYMRIRDNERPRRPVGVREEDWERLRQPILDAISAACVAKAERLPEFYRQYLDNPDLAEGALYRLLRRAPDELFSKSEDDAASWFAERVDEEMVRFVFETAYRRVALSDVVLHGWDVATVERPTEKHGLNWELVEGDARVIDRREGLLREAQEIHYSFDETKHFTMRTTLPVKMGVSSLKKFLVSNHGDRSWHEIHATVEMAGERYEASQAAYLGTDRWQDITWQFASEDDDSIMMRNWIRLDKTGSSDFNEPGEVRLTLDFRHCNRLMAMANKYANNYREVLRRMPLWTYVSNSVLLVALNIAGQVIGSSLVAFSFARLRWPARDFCFMLVLATLMIPPQVTMIPVFLIFKTLGWYNTLFPLFIPSFFGSAFFIFLLRQFMRSIPADLEDSAKIDGCSYFGIYFRIILPLVKPALATIGIFTFQTVWNDFMGPLIYLSDQELYPLSLGLFALQTFQSTNFGLMMAAAVLMTLPVIILFFLAQRQFIQGITLTGMKG